MLSRRRFLKHTLATVASAVLLPGRPGNSALLPHDLNLPLIRAQTPERLYVPNLRAYERPSPQPNILFIGIDDLNDWVGCLGGHPDVQTPNIDRLAQRGTLFTNAHAASPICNASRTALMTGIAPSNSGIYINGDHFRTSPVLKDAVILPRHFSLNGYRSFGAGKMFCTGVDPRSWDDYWPSLWVQQLPSPEPPYFPMNGFDPGEKYLDWGPLDLPKEEMDDWAVADRVADMLSQSYDTPFFMACGFFHPHQPLYAPRQYFDMYPLGQISLPMHLEGDLDLADVPRIGRLLATETGEHERILRNDQWLEAVQGYLANVSFVDDCVGHVLAALDRSPHRDNTLVVLWSDHGWHLGQKLHWHKRTLWEEATKNILLFAGPGIDQGARVRAPVSLLDIYPTLIDICGLPPRAELEGASLFPLLLNPQAEWLRPALSTVVTRNGRFVHFSVRSERWRYIRYSDGTEELYDHENDRYEWYNVAKVKSNSAVKEELARWIPSNPMPPPSSTVMGSGRENDYLFD